MVYIYSQQPIAQEARNDTQAKVEAEAEALRLQKQNVTSDLIKLREIEAKIKAIDKWNGVLPKVTGGSVPFIGIDEEGHALKK